MTNESASGGDPQFGEFRLDTADERLLGPRGPVKLGNKAYRVLLMLVQQKGRLVTKDDLFTSVWDGTFVSESALTSVVKELRRALGDESRTPRYIESVYGRGYRLLAEVREASAGAEPPESLPSFPARAEPGQRLGQSPMLHVPPFEDSAVRETQPYLAEVLREEILLALSRFRDVGLISAAAESTAPQSDVVGEREYQLTLRLIPHSEGVRAFVRLSRLGNRAIIWGEQLELRADSLGAEVDGLVRSIVSAALPRMQDDILCNLPLQPRNAYDVYFLTKLKMRGMESLSDARGVAAGWEELISNYPDFTLAYPPLTRLYNTDYGYTGLGSCGPDERRRAYELAHRGLAIDPTDSHLHTVKGWAHLRAGEQLLAREHLRQALDLNPCNQRRLIELATAYMYLDDLDRAEELLKRCRSLTAFATEAPHEDQGLLHLLRGEYEQASGQLALVRRHHPDDPAGSSPTIVGELLSLLAAAGSGDESLAARADAWRALMAERWSGELPPDDDRLIEWVSFHYPFQDPARKRWFIELLERALRAGDPAARRIPGREHRKRASGPSAGAGPSPSVGREAPH